MEWVSGCDAPGTCTPWDPPPYSTDPRIDRVLRHGSSCIEPQSARQIVYFNRAGDGETTLTPEQLVAVYCHGAPNVRGYAMHEHTDEETNAWYAAHWPDGPVGETYLAVAVLPRAHPLPEQVLEIEPDFPR